MAHLENSFKLIDIDNNEEILKTKYNFDDIITRNMEMKKIIWQCKKVANSQSVVLIQGESGTGKEIIAQSIHNYSDRYNKPFIAINCGAIPHNLIESELFGYEEGAFTGAKKGGHTGKFQNAHGGTLFLDEIGDMPLSMQVKLLRVLQEGYIVKIGGNKSIPINIRIIAATNKDLKEQVRKNQFREDLYYRLKVIPIYIPPLRQRKEDIKLLLEHFLKEKSLKLNKKEPKIREDLYYKIINYNWPGNVRELENYVENIVNFDGESSFILDDNEKGKKTIYENADNEYICTLEELETKAIICCMNKFNRNISTVSKVLGISRNTLYNKLKKYNIEL